MKRTPISVREEEIPCVFHPFLKGASLYDSSCSPEARVIFIDRDGGYFLKSAPRSSLKAEADMTRFFFERGLGAEVLVFVSEEKDWLLTRRVAGEDCTHPEYLADPARLCDLLGERLRMLHESDGAGCPAPDRMDRYFATAEQNFRSGCFDLSYLPREYAGLSAEEAFQLAEENRHLLARDTLIHGDYCLPNVMLDNWRFSGFIDLGNGGMGDRHIDLFWGVWTLRYNLKTDRYGDRFLDAYGRDRVDTDRLNLIGAFEVFG